MARLLPFMFMFLFFNADGYCAGKTITLTVPDKKLSITIDYSAGCVIKALVINGRNTLSAAGVYTGVSTKLHTYSSALSNGNISVSRNKDEVILSGISYGD